MALIEIYREIDGKEYKLVYDDVDDSIHNLDDLNKIKKFSRPMDAEVIVNFADRVRLTDKQLNDVYGMVKQWSNAKSKNRAIEELLELSLSLLHLARKKTTLKNLRKEMADVRLALEHLEFKYGNYQKELDEKLAHNSKISE